MKRKIRDGKTIVNKSFPNPFQKTLTGGTSLFPTLPVTASDLSFLKMVGTGNDFVMIDNRDGIFPMENTRLVQKLCDRRNGIGADGIILIENSPKNHFRMRIVNADGSEADMCGNGARCAVRFAETLGVWNNTNPSFAATLSIETHAGELKAWIEKDGIRLNMGQPKDYRDVQKITLGEKKLDTYFVNTGVPHAVIFVDDVLSVPVSDWGKQVRHHSIFKPKGANCNFVQITGSQTIRVRTFERGVEEETFSCGTGTCAAAILAVLEKGLQWPVTSTTLRNEQLKVDSKISAQNRFEDFFLIGPANICFSGKIQWVG